MITYLKKFSDSAEMRNIFWMIADRIWRMIISLVVGVWVVRYLGPDNFGKINYVSAFVAIATVFVNLGMESFLIKEIVANPTRKHDIIATSFKLRFLFAFIVFIGILLLFWITNEPNISFILFFLLVAPLFTTSFAIVDLLFQAELKSRITIIVRNIFFVLSAGCKIVAILTQQSIFVFALLTIIDIALADIFLFFLYKAKFSIKSSGKTGWDEALDILKKCMPFLLSNIAVVIYMRIDQVLLGKLASVKEVGYFSAVTKVAEIFYFIPLVITGSLYGLLINTRNASFLEYKRVARKIFYFLLCSSILISLVISLAAPSIITFLFGEAFVNSIILLQAYIWVVVFIFAGVAFNQLLVIEEYNGIIFYKTFIGLVLNILFNLMLIPSLGAMGAVIATVITQFVSSIGANFLFMNSRKVFSYYLPTKDL